MEIIKSFILGIVQGLTEFLPVSSSGHIEIFKEILNFSFDSSNGLFFTLILDRGPANMIDDRLKLADYQEGTRAHMSWVYIKNGSKTYSVNGDTKLSGLKEFYSNRNNPCKTIYNSKGKLNLITNDMNGDSIDHLYIYRVQD